MAESSNNPEKLQEEDDYMGDLSKFIPISEPSKNPKKQPPKPTCNPSIQPSKKKNKSQISYHEQKKLEKERKQHEEDQQTLENLNSRAIPQSNIGFKLLTKMGYNPGEGLQKGGRVDPVGVEIRRSRAGIGGEDPAKARLRRERERMEREKMRVEMEKRGEEELLEDFGVRQRMQWRNKRVVSSFWKAKAVLNQLENKEVVVEKEGEEGGEVEEEEEEEEEVIITEEDLLEMLAKLREDHHYCLFCGCQYDSAEALSDSCPGIYEDDH